MPKVIWDGSSQCRVIFRNPLGAAGTRDDGGHRRMREGKL